MNSGARPKRRHATLPTGVWLVLTVGVVIRLWWASSAPLVNDEAYYWDWSRNLQLSYLDHPPGVAMMAWLGNWLLPGPLGARCLVPFLHLLAVLIMLRVAALLKQSGRFASTQNDEPGSSGPNELSTNEIWVVVLLAELVPAFSLEGVLLLPDAGLLPTLALALYAAVKICAQTQDRVLGRWVFVLGAALGVAGLFKYHAAVIALGLLLGLVFVGAKQNRLTTFTMQAGLAGMIALALTLPVWVWNLQHEFQSFRFQGSHGFSGLAWTPLAACRFVFGETVLLTPLVFLMGIHCVKSIRASQTAYWVLAAAFMPLFCLLNILAFGKQLLPHWVVPAFWCLLPAIGLKSIDKSAWRMNSICFGTLTLVLPTLIALAPARQALVESFHGQPGPLAEITLWEPLAKVLGDNSSFQEVHKSEAPARCERLPKLAALRWFWAAQLAANLPGRPLVMSLDLNHLSFYNYRDDLVEAHDCPVTVVGDRRHLDLSQLSQMVAVQHVRAVSIPSHADVPIIVIFGKFLGLDALRQLPRAGTSY